MYPENEYLMLSNIQHFSFCKKQWSYIVLEDQWMENELTTEGILIHKNADDEAFIETRKDVIISRSVPIVSKELGLSGICDVVEFHKNGNGSPIPGKPGRYIPVPVEYKRGHKKATNIDTVQLCAQAVCLEEMLNVKISYGYMYYNETRRREQINFTEELRNEVKELCEEMHRAFQEKRSYPAEYKKGCKSCSFYDVCLPESFSKKWTVREYINEILADMDDG